MSTKFSACQFRNRNNLHKTICVYVNEAMIYTYIILQVRMHKLRLSPTGFHSSYCFSPNPFKLTSLNNVKTITVKFCCVLNTSQLPGHIYTRTVIKSNTDQTIPLQLSLFCIFHLYIAPLFLTLTLTLSEFHLPFS